MGCYWQGNSAGWSFGGIVGPGPGPKTAPILTAPAGDTETAVGRIAGWSFPSFDESTKAVIRVRGLSAEPTDCELQYFSENSLVCDPFLEDDMIMAVNVSGANSFNFIFGGTTSSSWSVELLSLDHNGKQYFP